MDQNARTNLDQDLHLSRAAKYEKSEPEVANWIFNTLQLLQTERNYYNPPEHGLMELLKDGGILCKLGNLLGLPQAPTKKIQKLPHAFCADGEHSVFSPGV